jgi:hypothetical protein
MSQQIAMPHKVTQVEVTGTLESGEKVSQNFPVPHEDGVPDGPILAMAIQMFKQLGGLLVDQPDGSTNFYMAGKFVPPMTFALKKVVLVAGSAVQGLGPQLVQ